MSTTQLERRTEAPAQEGAEALRARIAELERQLEALRDKEEAQRRREWELADFLENSVVGLHRVGPDGTILWANRADHDLLGYSREEYVGRNIAEFHTDADAARWILQRVAEGKTLREHSAILRHKDGSVRHVLVSTNGQFEDGAFRCSRCFTIDVTAQYLLESALREAHTHLAAIVESSDDAVIGLDLGGRISSWNRGAMSIYGYAREEIVGEPIARLIPPELRDEEDEIFRRVRRGERVEHYETRRLRKCGASIDVSLTVSAVRDAAGSLIGISKVARDITDKKRLERERAEAARRKDEFLAILAHELRNPLAPIRYALSIARSGESDRAQRERAGEVIERQVEQMSRLLDDLLDVSRIARGHVELRRKWIDLTSVIGAAIDAARPLIDRKGHTLTLDLPREALQIEADPVRVTQILSNLLTNAAKYTDRGGHIQLRAWRGHDTVALAVRDNGIGIAPDMRQRLFQLFSQASSALQRSEGGLGIGLALVRGFVEMHGGSVEALSDGAGKGSEFIVRLPVGRPGHESPGAAPSPEPGPAKRLRVLIADDNEDAAQTCAMLIELWGHEARIAHSGAEALALAEAFLPAVALVDIGMPGMNGYEVARALRASPWAAKATLVAVTGWGQEEDKQAARDAGFDHHLTKPVDPARLQPLLASLC